MANTFKSPLQKAVVAWLAAHPDVSIAELARRAEIDKGDLSKIRNGLKASLNMESAVSLAAAMGTTVEGLLGGKASPSGDRSDGAARWIPLAEIDPSPDNPRKDFDAESLAQLAASIAEQGLLQPIVVRPKGERFEIVAGERRYRALKMNEATQALCLVRDGDDEATTRALRIIENLQRADIKPVEEADAFLALAELDPKKWTATTIAKAIGMSDRFVAQRLSIARNLAPDLKEKLKAGELKIEMARVLAGWPQTLQAKVQMHIWADASHIRRQLVDMVVPASRAAFDPALYTGEIVEHDGERHFVDPKEFRRLQTEAARDVVASLHEDYPTASFVGSDVLNGRYVWADTGERIYRWSGERETPVAAPMAGLSKDDVTALVYLDDRTEEIVVLKGVALAPTDDKAARESEREEEARATLRVDQAESEVRDALIDQMPTRPQLAQALFVYGAIGHLGQGLYVETDPKDYLGPWKAQLEGILEMDEHGWEPYDPPAQGEDRLWIWLQKQGPEQIEQMFCRLIGRLAAPVRYREPGAPHLAAFKALGVSIPEALQQVYDEAKADAEEAADEIEFEDDGADQAEAA